MVFAATVPEYAVNTEQSSKSVQLLGSLMISFGSTNDAMHLLQVHNLQVQLISDPPLNSNPCGCPATASIPYQIAKARRMRNDVALLFLAPNSKRIHDTICVPSTPYRVMPRPYLWYGTR